MDFVVAIPSYKRVDKLQRTTLAFLQTENIPTDKIFVFVANPEEFCAYQHKLDRDTYGTLVLGVPTIAAQRTFITNYFPIGTKILMMDDDIKKIKFLTHKPLISFVKAMFTVTERMGLTLWGINPANNLYFCKERICLGKYYIIACFMGLINTQDTPYPDVSACEDRWHSLTRYKRDGAVIRYDGACPDTIYFAKGGLSEYRQERQKADCETVVSLFPDDCKLKLRKDGYWDCVWRNIQHFTLDSSSVFI